MEGERKEEEVEGKERGEVVNTPSPYTVSCAGRSQAYGQEIARGWLDHSKGRGRQFQAT